MGGVNYIVNVCMNKKNGIILAFLLLFIITLNTTFASVYTDRTAQNDRINYRVALNNMQKILKELNVKIEFGTKICDIGMAYNESSGQNFGDWVDSMLKNCPEDESKIMEYFNGIISITFGYADQYASEINGVNGDNIPSKVRNYGSNILNDISNGASKLSDYKLRDDQRDKLVALADQIQNSKKITNAAISQVTGINLYTNNNKLAKSLSEWTLEQIDNKKPFSSTLKRLAASVKVADEKDEYNDEWYENNVLAVLNEINSALGNTADSSYDSSLILNPEKPVTALTTPVKKITRIILLILQVASVAGIMLNGIIYMFSSADAKADIKKKCINLVIGLVIVFGASSVISIVTSIAGEVMQ